MNKEFIEKIENKVKSIDIIDEDPFVVESCKNLYRALVVVMENENLPVTNISDILNDTNKTIELLRKFDSINKEKYNSDLNYIVVDINNYQTLLFLIELLKQSFNYSSELNSINENNKNDVNIDIINTILNSVLTTSAFLNVENIKDIKFLPSKQGYNIEISNDTKKIYMGISRDGYVEIVRENNIDGKIVYMPGYEVNSNNEINFNKIEQSVNDADVTIKQTLHKLISVKTYNNHDEFWNNIKNIEENSLFDIGSWWGENGYGMKKVVITNDKNLYKFFCEEAIKPTRYEIEMYESLSDEEFNNLISIINNNLLNAPEEENVLFDAGNFITINYNGIKKSFNNIHDNDKYQKIKNSIEELFV